MNRSDLEGIAAIIGWGGQIPVEEIVSIVNQLIADGEYSDDFITILEWKPADSSEEVIAAFKSYLEGKGIQIPSKDEAFPQVVLPFLRRIASRKPPPLDELMRMIKALGLGSAELLKYSESNGLRNIMSDALQYQDLDDDVHNQVINAADRDRIVRKYENEIVEEARDWVSRYSSGNP